MECRNIRALAAGDPAPPDRMQIQAHLERCAACRDELGELPPLLAAPPLLAPPAGFAARVLERLPAETPAVAAKAESSQRRRRRMFTGFGVLVAALILQVGLFGVFVDSSFPARIVGGAESGLGRLLLGLTMAAKPVAGLVTSFSFSFLLAFIVGVILLSWAWLRLAQPPAPLLVAVEVEP